ncbi:uncharacterized protein LOC100278770 [Zea mays]|uniref:Uncharacterized protein n=1 Tax=Zea mays TaxID=4577 RepID=B6TN43_MAIZE|nr:uncharacterized protein LOC100278770 [Zea mays]ACG38526.1 hypothetical protein [Zea mays]ACG47362.1 hypothetical protein [Zea mays]|eukprot:NP_001145410.1 uncharacterized protein LOC100278770 [Zea mays]
MGSGIRPVTFAGSPWIRLGPRRVSPRTGAPLIARRTSGALTKSLFAVVRSLRHPIADEQATVESEVQQVEIAEQELIEGEEQVVEEESPNTEEFDLI